MCKKEFLEKLRHSLYGLPRADIEERISFYSEMIDDRIEEGMTEEQAVLSVGGIEEIVSQTVADIPMSRLVSERVKSRRPRRGWEIALLALGSPIWLSLLIAAFAVVFSVYAVAYSLLISIWAVELSLAGCAVGGIISLPFFIIQGNPAGGFAILGVGIVCAGLSVLIFSACKATTKGILVLTKKSIVGIKSLFIAKEK